jgi:hypothetical protein
MNGDQEVIFAYSELHINAENAIAKVKGKKFVCGKLYMGLYPKQYTKRILATNLAAMERQYPDTKVIAQGQLKTFKYEDPKVVLSSSF